MNLSSISNKTDDLFEGRLRDMFKTVPPDPDFVQKLKKRLLDKAEIYLEQDSPSMILLLIISGMMAGMIILWFISKIFKR